MHFFRPTSREKKGIVEPKKRYCFRLKVVASLHRKDEWHIDMRSHRAQQLTQELMQTFDLVLCMSKDQESWIKQNYSSQRGKVYRIGHWINENVADPYKLPIEKFYESRAVLSKAVESWKDKLA